VKSRFNINFPYSHNRIEIFSINFTKSIYWTGLGFGRKTGSEQIHHAGAFEKFQNILDLLNEDTVEEKPKAKAAKKKKVHKESSSDDSSESDSDDQPKKVISIEAASRKAKGRVQ